MSCDPHKYKGVTKEVFDCVKKQVVSHGGSWEGDYASGKIDFEGKVKADYKGDAATGDFTVTVTKKPFVVTCGYVYGKIGAAISKCESAETMFGFIEDDE